MKFDNPIGVSGFNFLMLISGLLIAHSIFKRKSDERYDYKRYFLRRFSRIYPVLLVGFIIIIIFDRLNNYKFLEHFDTFLINILLLNDSALGYSYYGSSFHLWFLPLFWYLYLFFGWLLLGLRTTKRNYFLYVIILGFFSLIIVLICLGTKTNKKINYIIIWLLSASFTLFMNKLYKKIKENSTKNGKIENETAEKIKKKVKYSSFAISALLFILALSRGIYFQFENPYELIYNLFLAGAILFFLLFSQYTEFIFPKKIKKLLHFLASYSFTLFLIHLAVFSFLLKPFDRIFYFILIYIGVNFLSIAIAYITEFRSNKIYHFLLRIFKLEKVTNEKFKLKEKKS